MKLLFVTEKFPYPLTNGGNIRSFHILKILSQQYQITLLSLQDNSFSQQDKMAIAPFCQQIKLISVPRRTRGQVYYYLLQGIFSAMPYPLNKNFSPALLEALKEEIGSEEYHFIHFNHLDTAQYLLYLPPLKLTTILDTHNILSSFLDRYWQQEKNWFKKGYIWWQWQKMKRYEGQIVSRINLCLTCSAKDSQGLQQLAPGVRVEVIPNGVDSNHFTSQADPEIEPYSLIFVGALSYLPNYDGLLFFCQQVLPLIKKEIPRVKLYIIGESPPPQISALAQSSHVVVVDKPPDIRQYLRQASIMVVPLRFGGGTRIKILEAMALETAVVSTSVGAEGLNVKSGEQIILADTPSEMAQAIIQLWQAPLLRKRLVRSARLLLKKEYDWELIGKRLLAVHASLT